MGILLILLQGLFALYAVFLLFGFFGSKHIGLLLASIVYAGGVGCSIYFEIWWPLFAAFGAAWILRVLGFDPSPG